MTHLQPMGHRLAGLFLARLDRADREAVAGDLFELHTARRAAGAGDGARYRPPTDGTVNRPCATSRWWDGWRS